MEQQDRALSREQLSEKQEAEESVQEEEQEFLESEEQEERKKKRRDRQGSVQLAKSFLNHGVSWILQDEFDRQQSTKFSQLKQSQSIRNQNTTFENNLVQTIKQDSSPQQGKVIEQEKEVIEEQNSFIGNNPQYIQGQSETPLQLHPNQNRIQKVEEQEKKITKKKPNNIQENEKKIQIQQNKRQFEKKPGKQKMETQIQQSNQPKLKRSQKPKTNTITIDQQHPQVKLQPNFDPQNQQKKKKTEKLETSSQNIPSQKAIQAIKIRQQLESQITQVLNQQVQQSQQQTKNLSEDGFSQPFTQKNPIKLRIDELNGIVSKNRKVISFLKSQLERKDKFIIQVKNKLQILLRDKYLVPFKKRLPPLQPPNSQIDGTQFDLGDFDQWRQMRSPRQRSFSKYLSPSNIRSIARQEQNVGYPKSNHFKKYSGSLL